MECWWYIAGLQWGINKIACRHRHGAWEPVTLPPPQLFCLLWHSVPRGYLDPHWGQLDGSQRVIECCLAIQYLPRCTAEQRTQKYLPSCLLKWNHVALFSCKCFILSSKWSRTHISYCVSRSVLEARKLRGELVVRIHLLCRASQNSFLIPASPRAVSSCLIFTPHLLTFSQI